MIKFTELISESIDRVKQILLKPFNFKKWLILGFIALMAGYLGGGGSGGGGNSSKFNTAKDAKAQVEQSQSSLDSLDKPSLESTNNFAKTGLVRWPVPIIIGAVILILALVIVFGWLGARFNFVFLEAIIKDDASIVKPFKANAMIGNSFFVFNLILGLIILLLIALIVGPCLWQLSTLGVFNEGSLVPASKIFFTCLPYGLIFILFLLFASIVGFVNHELVTVVMYKDGITTVSAWKKMLNIIKLNKLLIIKCIFVRFGLAICCFFIAMLIHLIAGIAVLLPSILIGVLGFLIFKAIPQAMQTPFIVVSAIIFTPVVLFLLYCLICLDLPFAVFFRTFSIKFLGRLEDSYNLIP